MRVPSTIAVVAALAISFGLAAGSQAQRARPAAQGMVKSVDATAKSFVVTTMRRGGEARDVTVKTDASTTFTKGIGPNAAAGTFADVTSGKFVRVTGDGTPETGVTAKTIAILERAPGRATVGVVKSVDAAGHSFVLTLRRAGQERDVTVKWTDQTKVMLGRGAQAQAGSASDIATGKRVSIQGEGSPEAGYTATQIQVLPAAPGGAGAGAAPGQ